MSETKRNVGRDTPNANETARSHTGIPEASEHHGPAGKLAQTPNRAHRSSYGHDGSIEQVGHYGPGWVERGRPFQRTHVGPVSVPNAVPLPSGTAGHAGKGPKGYVRADERLRLEICDRLTDDDSIDASDISVTVRGGKVTLAGTVADHGSKQRVDATIARLRGVKLYNNALRPRRKY